MAETITLPYSARTVSYIAVATQVTFDVPYPVRRLTLLRLASVPLASVQPPAAEPAR